MQWRVWRVHQKIQGVNEKRRLTDNLKSSCFICYLIVHRQVVFLMMVIGCTSVEAIGITVY